MTEATVRTARAITAESAARTAYPFIARDALRVIIADQADYKAETIAETIRQMGLVGARDDAEDHPVGLFLEARMVEAGFPATGHIVMGERVWIIQARTAGQRPIIAEADITGPLLDLADLITDAEPDVSDLVRQGEHDER